MKILMQPKQIYVPEKEPFKNDLLDRQAAVNDLKNLVGNIDTPAVVAIDGAWGTGKTTFLNFWKQSLLDEKCPVVYFNAWGNDYSANSLVSILVELTYQLRESDAKFGRKDVLSRATIKAFKEIANSSLKIGSGGVLSIDAFINQRDIFDEHKLYKVRLEKFKTSLVKLAATYRKNNDYPLVIVIDELDRCRPTFAVDILEVAKHLFSTDGVVFVLALNQRQLGHSLASIYGDRFDSLGYLERFVDVTFRLPPVDRKNYLLSELSEKCKERSYQDSDFKFAIDLLFTVYALPDFNLRTASHYIRRLDYVLASTGYDKNLSFMLSLVVALIMRSLNRESYLQFYNGEILDDEFVDSIFKREGLHEIRYTEVGAWVEAIVIAAQQERERKKMNNENAEVSAASNLFLRYHTMINDTKLVGEKKKHAGSVMTNLQNDRNINFTGIPSPTFGKHFFRAVELIEKISPKAN